LNALHEKFPMHLNQHTDSQGHVCDHHHSLCFNHA
jgi:hypothetical protein